MSQLHKKFKGDSNVSSQKINITAKNEPRKADKHVVLCKAVINSEIPDQFASTSIFIVPEGIQSKRYTLIQNFARKNGFQCHDDISDRVTHIVSELNDVDQLSRLYPKLLEYSHLKIVSVQWLHTSVRQKSLAPEDNFLIPGFQQWFASRKQELEASSLCKADASENVVKNHAFSKELFNEKVLEREAPLKHCNEKLVEPLLFLNEYWTVMGDERRALAYSKAAATIKCLPFTVTNMNELDNLKGVGTGHSLKVLQEMLETGNSREVSSRKNSENFQMLKNLSTVYGIGPSLALKLHNNHNIKSVQDLITYWDQLSLVDERIKFGVAFHEDLNTPVSRDIATKILEIVKTKLSLIKEGHHIEVAGGFRRGKTSGHDVDLLITFDKNGDEIGVLHKLRKQLSNQGYILQSRVEKSSFDEEAVFRKSNNQLTTMDHFEKCFCIFKCPLHDSEITDDSQEDLKTDFGSLISASHADRNWRAVRVDLVIIPKSQWAYALLGWTGSKLYMRMLRHYANTVLQRSLNSHGMWDRKDQRLLPAESEEDVFQHLGLSYKDPFNRNF